MQKMKGRMGQAEKDGQTEQAKLDRRSREQNETARTGLP